MLALRQKICENKSWNHKWHGEEEDFIFLVSPLNLKKKPAAQTMENNPSLERLHLWQL